MNKSIAVLVTNQNRITDLVRAEKLLIYQKSDTWALINEIKNLEWNLESADALRESLDSFMEKTNGCKLLVAKSITGIPFHTLCKNNYELFEADEFSIRLLEEIFEDYGREKVKAEVIGEEIVTSPQKVDDCGDYFFDFIEVQKYHPEISSKKALLPFLSHTLFQTLTIRCSHVMPWLEIYTRERNLCLWSRRADGVYTVLISHQNCNEKEAEYEEL